MIDGRRFEMRLQKESIGDIYVSPDRRPTTPNKVKELAESLTAMGLLEPIVVRRVDAEVTMGDGEVVDVAYHLVAGRHRLEAAALLGWEDIDCHVVELTDRQARLWEIAENLHRSDLSQLDRNEQEAEWIRLWEEEQAAVSAQLEPKAPRGRHDIPTGRPAHRPAGGINAAVRELGIERNEAQRAIKIAGLDPEAKAVARETGLDRKQSALLKAAQPCWSCRSICLEPRRRAPRRIGEGSASGPAGPPQAEGLLEEDQIFRARNMRCAV